MTFAVLIKTAVGWEPYRTGIGTLDEAQCVADVAQRLTGCSTMILPDEV